MVMFYVFIFLLNPFNIMHICHTWTTHIATKSWTPRVSRVLRIPRNARKSSSNRPSWPKISTVWVTQRHETFSLFIHKNYTSNKSKCKYKKHSRLWLQNWCPDTHTQKLAHTHTQYEKMPYPNRRQQASGRALSVCAFIFSFFLSTLYFFTHELVQVHKIPKQGQTYTATLSKQKAKPSKRRSLHYLTHSPHNPILIDWYYYNDYNYNL